MIPGTMAFIAGVLACLQLAPGVSPLLPAGAGAALLATRWRRPAAAFLAGLLWAWWRADAQLAGMLPPSLEGIDLPVTAEVMGVPRRAGRLVRFEARLVSLDPERTWHGIARLSWYDRQADPGPGERWRLVVRLKRPRGFANPGTFDYERWLFARGIRAAGYVVDRRGVPQRLAPGGGLHHLRLGLGRAMADLLAGGELGGLVVALGVGIRHGIGEREWEVLRRSGTAHLMAISGLHVGLVAGLAHVLGGLAWRRSARLCGRLAAPRAAALAAVAAALGYALLAGFALPTQRAFVMVLAVAGGSLLGRGWPMGTRLAAAALMVVVLDPFAVLGAGFWLSFGAVSLILLGMDHRVGVGRHPWWRWGRVHLLVGLGLAPVTAGAFGLAPLAAPLANLLAVPWVGLLVVPLTLLGLALLPLYPPAAAIVLDSARRLLEVLWPVLERVADQGWTLQGAVPPAAALVATAGVVLLFAPGGLRGRWLGLLWLLPLLAAPRGGPAEGAARVTVLDVGQGLAVVVRTAHHVLVYDTGPRFPSGSDTADMVLVPYLRSRGIHRVDTLVVSHGDNDHAGGAATLLAALPVERVMAGGGSLARRFPRCRRGQEWAWDGVRFRILHPGASAKRGGNDGSCVLAVASGPTQLLLTGDLEAAGEQSLVATAATDLPSEVLLVPHHGSRTSTTPPFLDRVAPRLALLSTGHRNRFGFPDPAVTRRLESAGVTLADTAHCGALSLSLAPEGAGPVSCFRRDEPRWWRAPAGERRGMKEGNGD